MYVEYKGETKTFYAEEVRWALKLLTDKPMISYCFSFRRYAYSANFLEYLDEKHLHLP